MKVGPITPAHRLCGGPGIWGLPGGGGFFGMSRAESYASHARGEFPTPVHKIGSRFYVKAADIAVALGLDPSIVLETPADENSTEEAAR